jgi:hypothetical protein
MNTYFVNNLTRTRKKRVKKKSPENIRETVHSNKKRSLEDVRLQHRFASKKVIIQFMHVTYIKLTLQLICINITVD